MDILLGNLQQTWSYTRIQKRKMKKTLIMTPKPIEIKSAGIQLDVRENNRTKGTVVASGTKIRFYEIYDSRHGFEMDWNSFKKFMREHGRKF